MAFLSHFRAKKGHFLGGAALNQPLFRSLALQDMFFESSTCEIGWGGVELTTRPQKPLFSAQKWHFKAIFGQKWPFFGGAALNHPFSGSLTLQHMFL